MGAIKVAAVVPAAGQGRRMHSLSPKQFLPLAGKPVLARTLAVLAACPLIDVIVLVVDPEHVVFCRDELIPGHALDKIAAVLPGGAERQDSVYRGLASLQVSAPDLVLIHDGVRPLVPLPCVHRVIEAAATEGAAVLAVPVKDTIKTADESGTVQKTLDRRCLWAAQTPQAFSFPLLVRAYQQAQQDGYRGTDDSSLLERLGIEVKLVPGSYENIKITTPEDLVWATAVLHDRGED